VRGGLVDRRAVDRISIERAHQAGLSGIESEVRCFSNALRYETDACRPLRGIPLPYVEGLRMDEAMHPLAILCVGMYGELLPTRTAPTSAGGSLEIRI